MRSKVLDQGSTWIDRAFVVNDWYVSSYEPILDIDGKRVGMLYAGFLEKPFRDELWKALAVLVLMFLSLMLLSALSLSKPLCDESSIQRSINSRGNIHFPVTLVAGMWPSLASE